MQAINAIYRTGKNNSRACPSILEGKNGYECRYLKQYSVLFFADKKIEDLISALDVGNYLSGYFNNCQGCNGFTIFNSQL